MTVVIFILNTLVMVHPDLPGIGCRLLQYHILIMVSIVAIHVS